jgi:hypothetical protein
MSDIIVTDYGDGQKRGKMIVLSTNMGFDLVFCKEPVKKMAVKVTHLPRDSK